MAERGALSCGVHERRGDGRAGLPRRQYRAMELRFYYDVVCPYAYLASTRVEQLAARCGATLRWRPILLGGLFREHNAAQNPGAEMNAARARLNILDMHRWASLWGVPLTMPASHPRRTVSAMRSLVAAPEELRPALSRALFRAYWVDGVDISDRQELDALARAHGLDPQRIDSDEARAGLYATTSEAARAGAFGVPSFVVARGDGSTTLFWGQDRMHLVERALGRAEARSQLEPAASFPRRHADVRLRFFHDFASPFSYLAQAAVGELAAAHGVTVEWAPILLGGLFRAIGTANVPLHTFHAVKQAYVRRDMQDWAALRGVPLRFPSRFPIRTVLPLRVALAEPAVTPHIYRAIWADDRPVDTPEALGPLLAERGFDARALLERAQTPAIKQALRRNTEEAQAAGACGVPTLEVTSPGRPPALFWGQDRLEMAFAAVRGWRADVDLEASSSV